MSHKERNPPTRKPVVLAFYPAIQRLAIALYFAFSFLCSALVGCSHTHIPEGNPPPEKKHSSIFSMKKSPDNSKLVITSIIPSEDDNGSISVLWVIDLQTLEETYRCYFSGLVLGDKCLDGAENQSPLDFVFINDNEIMIQTIPDDIIISAHVDSDERLPFKERKIPVSSLWVINLEDGKSRQVEFPSRKVFKIDRWVNNGTLIAYEEEAENNSRAVVELDLDTNGIRELYSSPEIISINSFPNYKSLVVAIPGDDLYIQCDGECLKIRIEPYNNYDNYIHYPIYIDEKNESIEIGLLDVDIFVEPVTSPSGNLIASNQNRFGCTYRNRRSTGILNTANTWDASYLMSHPLITPGINYSARLQSKWVEYPVWLDDFSILAVGVDVKNGGGLKTLVKIENIPQLAGEENYIPSLKESIPIHDLETEFLDEIKNPFIPSRTELGQCYYDIGDE